MEKVTEIKWAIGTISRVPFTSLNSVQMYHFLVFVSKEIPHFQDFLLEQHEHSLLVIIFRKIFIEKKTDGTNFSILDIKNELDEIGVSISQPFYDNFIRRLRYYKLNGVPQEILSTYWEEIPESVKVDDVSVLMTYENVHEKSCKRSLVTSGGCGGTTSKEIVVFPSAKRAKLTLQWATPLEEVRIFEKDSVLSSFIGDENVKSERTSQNMPPTFPRALGHDRILGIICVEKESVSTSLKENRKASTAGDLLISSVPSNEAEHSSFGLGGEGDGSCGYIMKSELLSLPSECNRPSVVGTHIFCDDFEAFEAFEARRREKREAEKFKSINCEDVRLKDQKKAEQEAIAAQLRFKVRAESEEIVAKKRAAEDAKKYKQTRRSLSHNKAGRLKSIRPAQSSAVPPIRGDISILAEKLIMPESLPWAETAESPIVPLIERIGDDISYASMILSRTEFASAIEGGALPSTFENGMMTKMEEVTERVFSSCAGSCMQVIDDDLPSPRSSAVVPHRIFGVKEVIDLSGDDDF